MNETNVGRQLLALHIATTTVWVDAVKEMPLAPADEAGAPVPPTPRRTPYQSARNIAKPQAFHAIRSVNQEILLTAINQPRYDELRRTIKDAYEAHKGNDANVSLQASFGGSVRITRHVTPGWTEAVTLSTYESMIEYFGGAESMLEYMIEAETIFVTVENAFTTIKNGQPT